MRYFVGTRLLLVLSLLWWAGGNPLQAGQSLVLAVHPFLSHDEVEKRFTPLADYLSRKTGYRVTVKVGSDYDEHIRYIGKDKVDIAYMGPASYVKMTSLYGQKPVLAKVEVNGRSFFQGNIVVRKKRGIESLSDLKGKRIAFGDPNSTMSYIVPHHMLHKHGIFANGQTSHEFLYSHTNVALGVLAGDFDAGAVKPAVFRKYAPQGLQTIAVTPKISEHLFVSRADLEPPMQRKIRDVMLEMGHTPDGLAALRAIKKGMTGLVPASSSDYDNLRLIVEESKELH